MSILEVIKEQGRLNKVGSIFGIDRRPFESNFNYRMRMLKVSGENSLLMPLLGMLYKEANAKEITVCLNNILGGSAIEIKQSKNTKPEDLMSIINGLIITYSRMKKVKAEEVVIDIANFFEMGEEVRGRLSVDASHEATDEEKEEGLAQLIYKSRKSGKTEILVDGELGQIMSGVCGIIIEVASRIGQTPHDMLNTFAEAIQIKEEV